MRHQATQQARLHSLASKMTINKHVLLAFITALIVVVVAAVVGVGLYWSSHCTFDYSFDSPSSPTTTQQCSQRHYTPSQLDYRAINSCVCVCSERLGCDKPTPLGDVPSSALVYYLSSRDGDRLRRYDTGFSTASRRESDSSGYTRLTVTVDGSRRYQEILGFGGAFTDSSGVNINAMSEPVRDMIMQAYFGEEGGFF